MSLRWDSPKEEWDRALRASKKATKSSRKSRDPVRIQNIFSAIVYLIVLVAFLLERT
jgi:hypothetical protein